MRTTLFLIALLAAAPALAGEVIPLPNAHAHNDYRHERPLFDALDHGFCSFEADIHLVDGALLVAHDADEVEPGKTLEKLYLDPLLERVRANGGRVYPGGPTCMLLIDFKTDGEATYAVLRPLLARYAEMLTVFRDGQVEEKAVTVVISGDRPRATMAAETERLCGYDGRVSDIDGDIDPAFMPLVSDSWRSQFTYRLQGDMSAEERAKLRRLVEAVHARGAKIRFWAVPEREALWTEMADAGVDYLNTDRLDAMRDFLLARRTASSE